MNAVATREQFMADNNGGRSDSDTDPEDLPEYYQPISALDGGDNESEFSDEDGDADLHQLPNGYAPMENELSSLDLSDGEDEAEEEEGRMRETEIGRAMREDEMRRNTPLTAETAGRVMEAMRGVQFGGPPPQWAGRVTEDDLIHQIRNRLGSRPQSVPDSSPIHNP